MKKEITYHMHTATCVGGGGPHTIDKLSQWVVSEYIPPGQPEPEMEVMESENMEVEQQQRGPVIVRTTEDILAYIQKKNPNVVPFKHDDDKRMYIKFTDFYMAVCNVKDTAARSAKSRLLQSNPELCNRLIKYKQMGGESHIFHVRAPLLQFCNNGSDPRAHMLTECHGCVTVVRIHAREC